jgi:hypothetical protein
MYFENILNKKILALEPTYDINSIFDYEFNDNVLYKLSYVEKFEAPAIDEISLNNTYYSNESSRYPENAIKIELKKGTYRISWVGGCLIDVERKTINDCIWTSKGKLKLSKDILLLENEINGIENLTVNDILKNHDDLFVDNYFDIKISSASKLHIWINSKNVIGEINFKINKIDKKDSNNEINELIFDSSNFPKIQTTNDTMYEFVLDKLIEKEIVEPEFKYPVGTYQIILNNEITQNNNINELIKIQSSDKKQYNTNVDGKLISLNKIEIPKDVDPLNFYFMLGKCELICFIDFLTDKYYFYPNSYAECFMNLFLPDSKIETIEDSKYYLKFKITEYKHISYNFKDKNDIITNFSKWLDIKESDIYYDEYELYYYAKTYNLYNTYFSQIIPKYIDFDKYFVFIELDITCMVKDNVSEKIKNEDILLDYVVSDYKEDENNNPISGCLWKLVDSKPKEYNYIEWSKPEEWYNTDTENELISYINGHGYLKISKQRFKNLFKVDLDYIKYGNLDDTEFKMLKLNDPIVSPYERFQYWMNIKM